MSGLVERLEEEAMQHSASSIRNGCPDCGIASNLANEAAARIEALERALERIIEIDQHTGERAGIQFDLDGPCAEIARSTLHPGRGSE